MIQQAGLALVLAALPLQAQTSWVVDSSVAPNGKEIWAQLDAVRPLLTHTMGIVKVAVALRCHVTSVTGTADESMEFAVLSTAPASSFPTVPSPPTPPGFRPLDVGMRSSVLKVRIDNDTLMLLTTVNLGQDRGWFVLVPLAVGLYVADGRDLVSAQRALVLPVANAHTMRIGYALDDSTEEWVLAEFALDPANTFDATQRVVHACRH